MLDDDMHRVAQVHSERERASTAGGFGSTAGTGRQPAGGRPRPKLMPASQLEHELFARPNSAHVPFALLQQRVARPHTARPTVSSSVRWDRHYMPSRSVVAAASAAVVAPAPHAPPGSPRSQPSNALVSGSSSSRPATAAAGPPRAPPAPKADTPASSARAALEWYTARLAEEKRLFAQRLAQAESKKESAQQEVQRLRIKVAGSPRTSKDLQREEDAYGKMKEQLGKAGETTWRRVQEAGRERDAALSKVADASRENERLSHEAVLLRGELARAQRPAAATAAFIAAMAKEAEAEGEGASAAAYSSSAAAAAASSSSSLPPNAQPPHRDDDPWTTVGWVASQPPVSEAIASALMSTLPRGGWPSAAKSVDDHVLERASLRRLAEQAEEADGGGVDGGGREQLLAALRRGGALEKLADALWPAIEALAREDAAE